MGFLTTLGAVKPFFLSLLFLSPLLASCAYHLGNQERDIPGGYRTVAVPVFKNNTMETGVEVYFTNALIREFARSRIGRITEKSQAQTTLEGTITSISYIVASQIGSSETSTAIPNYTVLTTGYRVFVKTSLRLIRNSDQKVLWAGNFEGERSYLAPKVGKEVINSADPLYNQSARNQNLQIMAKDIMTEAHNRLTENF